MRFPAAPTNAIELPSPDQPGLKKGSGASLRPRPASSLCFSRCLCLAPDGPKVVSATNGAAVGSARSEPFVPISSTVASRGPGGADATADAVEGPSASRPRTIARAGHRSPGFCESRSIGARLSSAPREHRPIVGKALVGVEAVAEQLGIGAVPPLQLLWTAPGRRQMSADGALEEGASEDQDDGLQGRPADVHVGS